MTAISQQTTSEPRTLVIGGTGKTGRRVAKRLSALGVPVRIGSRTGSPPFDWDDESTWEPVLHGVGSAYVAYHPDLAFPGASDRVESFTRLAVAAGVRRLVLLSGRGEEGAVRSEQAVQRSGADWTIVRASWFAQNFSESFLVEPVRSGVIALPAADMAEPFVDADDIADVAVAALTEEGHSGRLYEVTGPRLLTFADAAAEITRATGHEVRYLPVSPDEFVAGMVEQGVPEDDAYALTELFAEVLDGRNASVTHGVRLALGREPNDFAHYALAAAASGVWTVGIRDGGAARVAS